jgi:ribosomal protein S18 acetylase RimI-like enzyme
VGYAVFEKIDAETIYIAELALMPEIWRQGLGRKMTFAILDKEPTARRIVLVTERINILSQRFYTSLGFKPSSYRHDGYADEAYCSFEKTICPALLD